MAEGVALRRRESVRAARRAVPRPLGGLVAAAAGLYALYSLLRLWTFRASTYDLVIFDQAVRGYSRFGAPVSIAKGVHNGFGPDFHVLGDHFSPILVTLAPLYWLHDGPETLLLAQAVLFALAAVPVWHFTRRRLGVRAAYLAAGAYALSWPLAEALAFDFHEVAFAPLLTALLIERWDAGRRGHAVLAAALLLLVKEDMGLLVAGFGLVLLTRPGERRAGAAFTAAGAVAAWVASRVLIAAFGGDNDYYWAYGGLGPDVRGVVAHALTHPWDVAVALGTPPRKLATMALLVAPLLFLPLLSRITLAALPLLAERMLADEFANWWQASYHYNAFLVVVLVLAAVDAAQRFGPVSGRRLVAGTLAGAVAVLPFFALADLARPGWAVRDARATAAARAVAHVPDGALVEAANRLGPALTGRARVLLWDAEPRHAPWVVADVAVPQFPFASVAEQRARVAWLRARGYRTVYEGEGFVVLTVARRKEVSTQIGPSVR
ncbi:DUF2079 domain-containing protein [Actinomadura flavalba]|uniref:DUF2079 domain-containing protein n=1 Tax=Actinomadura flavalba TaxID=1120938 RepID=UPI00039ACF7F|nr:DUF2079 domain-containing protein [Actinomadura flavalba]